MAKVGNVVDAETAKKYSSSVLPEIRPVIWPSQFLGGLSMPANEIRLPQRNLCHLLCLDGHLDAIYSIVTMHGGNYLCSAINIELPYDYNPTFTNTLPSYRMGIVISEQSKNKLLKTTANKFFDENNLFTVEELLELYESIKPNGGKVDSWRGGFGRIGISLMMLEHFAFSPVATTKLRPTHRHMGNPRKYPLRFEPIEVINLRLPEKIDHPESTGRSINLRFPVIEHLRRIRDRQTGEEKLIKVREHWRGPEDAPVKPHTEKVYKVTR